MYLIYFLLIEVKSSGTYVATSLVNVDQGFRCYQEAFIYRGSYRSLRNRCFYGEYSDTMSDLIYSSSWFKPYESVLRTASRGTQEP